MLADHGVIDLVQQTPGAEPSLQTPYGADLRGGEGGVQLRQPQAVGAGQVIVGRVHARAHQQLGS